MESAPSVPKSGTLGAFRWGKCGYRPEIRDVGNTLGMLGTLWECWGYFGNVGGVLIGCWERLGWMSGVFLECWERLGWMSGVILKWSEHSGSYFEVE